MADGKSRTLFHPTVTLAVILIAIIVMMILPMPSWALDLGLAASFALAILFFTVTLFIERPLDFSAFPTLLLASLMLRLSLNVSSTKLIIGNGQEGTHAAGRIIRGFADFVMGDNILIGLIVFLVLLIVNFLVITKGAARMAEVGARFALDGMPGRQLAIDSDMSAGAIDHQEAKRRRETEQKEATFFGSLDGASKFVKGDAVAGLLITFLNFVVGIIVGTVMHGMPLSQAVSTYSILTVGDGLVTQIPAVIISIATALLLARGGEHGSTDTAVFAQLGRHPAALGTVSALMVLLAIVPGLPALPFGLGGALLGAVAWQRRGTGPGGAQDAVPEAQDEPQFKTTLGDVLEIDDVHVEFAPNLVRLVLDPATGLDTRIANMRRHVATKFGVILPEIRLTDSGLLDDDSYVIRIQGVKQAQGILRGGQVLALNLPDGGALPPGEDVQEPVYGAPARWISETDQERASLGGSTVVQPAEVLATHLLETLTANLPRLLTIKTLRKGLDELTNLTNPVRSEANRRFLDEMIPEKVTVELLHKVLKLLLAERVSVRNIALIIEAIAEAKGLSTAPEVICEYVRQKIGFQLIEELKLEDGSLPLVNLAPDWEEIFAKYEIEDALHGFDVALPPDLVNQLAQSVSDEVNKSADRNLHPAILTTSRRRRFLKSILGAKKVNSPVLSYEEIGFEARPMLVGTAAA